MSWVKRCWKCKDRKPIEDFYFQRTANRYDSKCKLCTAKQAALYLKTVSPEKMREYWRTAARNRTDLKEAKARAAARNAVKTGKIVKQPCEKCGEPKTQAHHTDYDKPLDVTWLCHKHHRAVHYPHAYPELAAPITHPN